MKYWFLRHWKSGSKGQQALRGDKQTRWVLSWAHLPAFSEFPCWAPRGGFQVNFSFDSGDEAEYWWRVRQLELTGQRSSDSYLQSRCKEQRYGYQSWKGSSGVRDQTTGSRTWVMFTRMRQDMRSSCLANHVTPATPVTETKNCLYISRHTPLFGALVGFHWAGRDLGPSALEINSLLAFALLWWTCSLGRSGDMGSVHNIWGLVRYHHLAREDNSPGRRE